MFLANVYIFIIEMFIFLINMTNIKDKMKKKKIIINRFVDLLVDKKTN